MAEEIQTVEQMAEETPMRVPTPVFGERRSAKVDNTLTTALRKTYDDRLVDLIPLFEAKDLKAAEVANEKARKAFEKEVKKGEIKPTEEEIEALTARKKSTVGNFKYAGIGVGVFVGLMLMASPPGILVTAITGIATLFGAGTTGIATTTTAAITANVALAIGTLLAGALGVAGNFIGGKTGEITASFLKPESSRKFLITSEQQEQIKKDAADKAKIHAAKEMVQAWTEEQSGNEPAIGKKNTTKKTEDNTMAKHEAALASMISRLQLDLNTETPSEAIAVFEKYQQKVTQVLDGEHAEKIRQLASEQKQAADKAQEAQEAIRTRQLEREDRSFNLQEMGQLAQLQVGMRKAGISDEDPIMKLLSKAGAGEGGLDAMQTMLLAQMLSGRSRGGNDKATPTTPPVANQG